LADHLAMGSACSRTAYSASAISLRWESTIQTDRTRHRRGCCRSAGNRAIVRDRQGRVRSARRLPQGRTALGRSTAMSGISSRSRPWVIQSLSRERLSAIGPAGVAVAPLAKNTALRLARNNSVCCRTPPDVRLAPLCRCREGFRRGQPAYPRQGKTSVAAQRTD
jgi:hypothetical protein